ncbi:DUF1223 domain-containing protein [Pedobacter sp. SD-b]|uniref:DUF1223 domain-containing protein n=1 Tax=Pedobacter segetis TaxID=2793069 RepID=A0ABS1BF40_9SPHI|nr:DUF1223 domain-containing protein [Pedobacter segetis]MBK0381430.1 DUF1223 domain-containing protein [Pedobacter segetis]
MKKVTLSILILTIALFGCLSFTKDKKENRETINTDGNKGFAVVELYTSEGCSSCPSADKLLKEIREEYKNQKVYVLAYHVDYWNRLGWKDVFSDHRFSERQSAYANNFKNSSVYTPQAIVNGKEQMVGSASGELKGVIKKHLGKNESLALEGSVKSSSDKQVELMYKIDPKAKNQDLVVNLVQKNASTNVKAGENGGRILEHANVVRYYTVVNIKDDSTSVKIDLPNGLGKEDFDVIAFVQEKNKGEILAANEIVF